MTPPKVRVEITNREAFESGDDAEATIFVDGKVVAKVTARVHVSQGADMDWYPQAYMKETPID